MDRLDANYVGFLDNWDTAARLWPKDWAESSIIFISLFRDLGCQFLNLTQPPADWPPDKIFWPPDFGAGVNPCVENGFYYPVKPLSMFCPKACGCRSGDAYCPDTCPDHSSTPERKIYTGVEPFYLLPAARRP